MRTGDESRIPGTEVKTFDQLMAEADRTPPPWATAHEECHPSPGECDQELLEQSR
ncbi:hypothetical protein ACFOSC_17450 [Streptantibioticus rubrisoli]|uniref:Uncharacterized protein n=1 Tax=Streptantibioticus rubrisoli TaxID=1387313 RepID=A0ABT1PK12_9ACTN|nr:hypothetical protein [Streptantibioticus rubrisoli]MCQ4044853.1 hypothetical protein [Streptantibioticus rubrisoli]